MAGAARGITGGATNGGASAAGASSDDAAGESAAAGGAAPGKGGAAGATNLACGAEPIDEATALLRATRAIRGSEPGLAADVTFAASEISVDGLWQSLQVQLFSIAYEADGSPFRMATFMSYGEHIDALLNDATTAGLSSAVVRGDALYYSYASGSGVVRSLVGRLRLRDCLPELVESGGYAPPDSHGTFKLFLRQDGENLVAEKGRYLALNDWSDPVWFGTVSATDTSIDLLDSEGHVIAPDFPRTAP
jgi:hypothetical protein